MEINSPVSVKLWAEEINRMFASSIPLLVEWQRKRLDDLEKLRESWERISEGVGNYKDWQSALVNLRQRLDAHDAMSGRIDKFIDAIIESYGDP